MLRLRLRTLRNSLLVLWLAALIAPGSPVAAQGIRDSLGLGGKGAGSKAPPPFKVELVAGQKAGEVLLKVSATLPRGSYTYNTRGNVKTEIDIDATEGLEPIDDEFTPNHPAKPFDDQYLGPVEKFTEDVTWTKRFRAQGGSLVKAKGEVSYQVCNDKSCIPGRVSFDLELAVAAAKPEKAAAPEVEEAVPPAAAEIELRGAVAPANGLGLGDGKPLPQFRTTLQPGKDPREVLLEIDVAIPPDYYIYSTGENGGAETVIEIDKVVGLEPIEAEFSADHPPKPFDDPTLKQRIEKYVDHVKWTQRYRITAPDAAETPAISGTIHYQICGNGVCRIKKHPFSTAPANGNEALPAPGGPDLDPVVRDDDARADGLFWFMLRAMSFGFAALLTPCAFPMVPITVSFFHKQSEKAHHRPVAMALVYCGGIVVAFTVLGILFSALFGPAFLNLLANNPWFNLFLGFLLVYFALNLLGMFEIRIPSWLLTFTATQEGRGGMVGVLFMALTFTLTSFTCTFAFVGTVLVDAANGDRLWPAVGLLAFSAAFSLPFFFLALFPSLLQKLPRSGGWMNVVKVVMGLLELGAAFKFFSVADLSWNPVAWIFDYELVMAAWMIIAIVGGLYLLGLFRLPHDMPTDFIGVPRFVGALSFFGLAAYLAVGLYATEKPTGKVWENIAAFAPPKFKGGETQFGPVLDHGGILYALDFEKALDFAARRNKPVFLDFTGVNCTNCRLMEKGPLSQPEITTRLKEFVCVQVYADSVPTIADRKEARRLRDFNVELQTRLLGKVELPSYAVIPPDPRFAQAKAGANLLAKKTEGYDPNGARFAQFLDEGMTRWQKLQARRPGEQAVGLRDAR